MIDDSVGIEECTEFAAALTGQTVRDVVVIETYGRVDAIQFVLENGRRWEINHWAAYADDSGLDADEIRD